MEIYIKEIFVGFYPPSGFPGINVVYLVIVFLSLILPVGAVSHSWIAAGAEPDAHQFMSRFVYKRGYRMEVNSKQCCFNSETRPGMHGQVRS